MASRNQVIYNSVAVFTSSNVSSGFCFLDSDGQESNNFNTSTYNLTFPISRVQEVSYGFSHPRTDIKSLGYAGTLARNAFNSDVNLSLSFLEYGLINFLRLGLKCNYPTGNNLPLYITGVCPIDGLIDRTNDRETGLVLNWPKKRREPKNIYIATKNNLEDINDVTGNTVYKSTDVGVYCFADAYLNSWKTSCAVGGLPQSSMDWTCSNIMFYSSGSGLNSPSLNPRTNLLNSGILFNLPNNFEGNNPTVLLPSDITININHSDSSIINNLPISLNDIKIQNYDISLDLNREPLYNAGYKLPLDRPINLPIFANLNFNVIAGENGTGSVLDNLNRDKEYDIKIKLNYQSNSSIQGTAIQYEFKKSKFNGINLSESISNRRAGGFSFTSELRPGVVGKGFFISGQLGISGNNFTSQSDFLLDTSGDYLLLEDGGKIIIDSLNVLSNSILY